MIPRMLRKSSSFNLRKAGSSADGLQSMQDPGVNLHPSRASHRVPGPLCGHSTCPRTPDPQRNPFALTTDPVQSLSCDPAAMQHAPGSARVHQLSPQPGFVQSPSKSFLGGLWHSLSVLEGLHCTGGLSFLDVRAADVSPNIPLGKDSGGGGRDETRLSMNFP